MSSVSNELEGNPIVPKVRARSYHVPIEEGGSSPIFMTPPLSSLVTSFEWSQLEGYCLPSYVNFQITIWSYHMDVPSTFIDEGAFVSILYSTCPCHPKFVIF